jgi:signal recognition particle GTPase
MEYPISHKNVPDTAKKVICELFPGEKVKWILERNNSGDNLEAKLKVNKTRISIEFDRNGFFEDLEVELPLSDVEKEAANKIKSKLESDFDRFKIKKIQHHYSGNQVEVLKLYQTGVARLRFISQRFEIVVYGIKDKKINSYEYLFSLEGDFGERLINAEENTDNLLF